MDKTTYEAPRIERSAVIEPNALYCKHKSIDPQCDTCNATVDACAEILVRKPHLVPGSERPR